MMSRLDSGLDTAMTPRTTTAAIGGTWLWDTTVRGGDWIFTTGPTGPVPVPAQPGTPEYTTAGWITIHQEGHP